MPSAFGVTCITGAGWQQAVIGKPPPSMIPSAVRETLLNAIMKDWRGLSPIWRPDRMWVREYGATNEAGDGIPNGVWPEAYWVLDENGLQEQCVIQWRRLEAVQFGFGMHLLPRKIGENERPLNYESGLASLAPLPDTDWYYYESIYGPTWGTGHAVQVGSDGVIQEGKVVWRS